jgi:hypothetical protein
MPTWFYDPRTGDMLSDSACGLCGLPAVGMASIDNTAFCHGQGRDCYQQASTIIRRRRTGLDGLLSVDEFMEHLDDDDGGIGYHPHDDWGD